MPKFSISGSLSQGTGNILRYDLYKIVCLFTIYISFIAVNVELTKKAIHQRCPVERGGGCLSGDDLRWGGWVSTINLTPTGLQIALCLRFRLFLRDTISTSGDEGWSPDVRIVSRKTTLSVFQTDDVGRVGGVSKKSVIC